MYKQAPVFELSHVSPEAVECRHNACIRTKGTVAQQEGPKENVTNGPHSPNIIAPATNDTLLSAFGPERDGAVLATTEGIRTAITCSREVEPSRVLSRKERIAARVAGEVKCPRTRFCFLQFFFYSLGGVRFVAWPCVTGLQACHRRGVAAA